MRAMRGDNLPIQGGLGFNASGDVDNRECVQN